MSHSKNNFTDPKVLAKVEYHCWILHVHNAKWNGYSLPRKKTYNGFLSKKDNGLQSLKNLVAERSSIIEAAQIYITKEDKLLHEWDSVKKCWS